jgi:mannan endo-1,4-beta-mannosidase
MNKALLLLFLSLLLLSGCVSTRPIDANATQETRALYTIPDTTWWTNTLLATMKKHDMDLPYVLVWRNDTRSPTHYYAPFPGHVSVPNFMQFYHDPYTLFEKDLNNIYKRKKVSGIF